MKPAIAQTILLVEDEDNDVLFMKMALAKLDAPISLQVAEHGEEAIDYLSGRGRFADRQSHPLPALVLLDLKLPRVMGMDVLKWIRDQSAFDMMVVIMLTASQQRTDLLKAYALGANSYLVKPSHPLDLSLIMDLVYRYWLQLNQPTATLRGVQTLSRHAVVN